MSESPRVAGEERLSQLSFRHTHCPSATPLAHQLAATMKRTPNALAVTLLLAAATACLLQGTAAAEARCAGLGRRDGDHLITRPLTR